MLRQLWSGVRSHPGYVGVRDFLTPPYTGYRFTLKRLLNLYLARYEQARGRTILRSRPIRLTVDPINTCNLRCPACLTGAGEVGRVQSTMDLDLYRRLLRELGDYLLLLEIGSWGEPLLSKDIDTIIAEASARGIATVISTHFSLPFDAASAERLVASGLTVLGVAIDGARQETYERYRVRGNLETVLANCRLVVEAKKRLGATRPQVVWVFHAFPHNVGDVDLAKATADELGMDFDLLKGWVVGEEWNADGAYKFFQDPSPGRCDFLWQYAVVNTDGGVTPCSACFYREDDVATITKDACDAGTTSFMQVWNGPAFQQARALYRSRPDPDEGTQSICFNCPQTIMWERWQQHQAAGGTRELFDPGFTTNDAFNYFFHRRLFYPAQRPHRRASSLQAKLAQR